jgi:murein endopeptidase
MRKQIVKRELESIEKLLRNFKQTIKFIQPTAYELPLTSSNYVRYGTYHWGTKETIAFAEAVANSWQTNGNTPKLYIGDISDQVFANTTGHYGHKTGTHVDFDLPGNLMDDPDYTADKQKKCAALICYMIILGSKRVIYNDSTVKVNVNTWAVQMHYAGRVDDSVSGHGNHIHAELPL